MRIATEGYGQYQENGHYLTLVFLPLYPWVCKLFLLLFHNVQAVFVIVSNLFFIAGATFYHATVSKKYGAACANTMLLLLMLSPFSFFFGAMMPESTFLFCWAAALYFARKKWWALACLFGALGALTRLLGVLIVVMIFIEMLQNDKLLFEGGKKQRVKKLLKYGLLGIVPLGTAVYLLVNFVVAGDAFAFLYYEKLNWFQKFTPIWESLYRVAQNVAEPSGLFYTVWLPELIAIVLIIALLLLFARSYALSELWYVLIYAVMTYSTSWLLSGARYLLACFPAFTMGALLLQRHQKAKTLVLIGCGFLQMIYFVGYLQGKAIM
ncbi:MAG: glycosyltransferase family 39 protein [Pygmaiobacter sp.]|nr:glycosyltransferase family 39 protein [Pygmaiobacter sp.]